jgi:3-hydroxy-3-methylglutaryl CoA synthase
MSDMQPAHVKVTINDLYKEQQETNKLLIQLASELKSMSDLPARVRVLELDAVKHDTVLLDVKSAQVGSRAALVGAILAVGTTIITTILGF